MEAASHVFEIRVLERYADGRGYEIGRIVEDDGSQLWQAWGPSNGGRRSFFGGYSRLGRAYDVVQERWLTDPAPAMFMAEAGGRVFRITTLGGVVSGGPGVRVDCTDVMTGEAWQTTVPAGLSVPSLLEATQIRDAISAVYQNATAVWEDGRVLQDGKPITAAQMAAIRPTLPGSGI